MIQLTWRSDPEGSYCVASGPSGSCRREQGKEDSITGRRVVDILTAEGALDGEEGGASAREGVVATRDGST